MLTSSGFSEFNVNPEKIADTRRMANKEKTMFFESGFIRTLWLEMINADLRIGVECPPGKQAGDY